MATQEVRKKNYDLDRYITKRILTTGPDLEMWRNTLSDLFIRSFSLAYRDVQLNLPPGQTLSEYLEHAFNDTWSMLQSGKLLLWLKVDRDTPEQVAGFMCVQTKDDICYIEQFAVHPDFQRMNIGSSLLTVLEERYRLIWLHTRHVNGGAIAFYTKRGFIRSDNGDDNLEYPSEFPSRSPEIYMRLKKWCLSLQS